MHYVISDIHNDNRRLREMLSAISFSKEDKLLILGDLFDRCEYDPDPAGVYFTILQLGEQCTVLRGNHDEWLAKYILAYYGKPERERKKLAPYPYNSFELLRKRLPPVDLQDLAHWILSKPYQSTVVVNGVNHLLVHDKQTITGLDLESGLDSIVSVFGHNCTSDHRLWHNERKNVWCIDCGCGFRSGQLGCLCLETQQEFYV